ncbi:transmembrane channel-like protein isoform X2 [Artemia franciscana]|uniref:transmembrane channel-like protein isoform X2 n=1 Tax=Artemia franciscana TaxID=6661 RepID=UPI0032DA74FC
MVSIMKEVSIEVISFLRTEGPQSSQPRIQSDEELDLEYLTSTREILERKKNSRRSLKRERTKELNSSLPVFTDSRHKDIIAGAKHQPWTMHKKLRLIRKAKSCAREEEGAIVNRLSEKKTFQDFRSKWFLSFGKKIGKFKRNFDNCAAQLIPWNNRIKKIESYFGSAVASYFVFLRWMFGINVSIAVGFSLFVIAPQVLFPNEGDINRQNLLEEEKATAFNFQSFWNFDGVLKYSPLFYGFYTNNSIRFYKLPLAYFLSGVLLFVYSYFVILRKMASNNRQSRGMDDSDDYSFIWKLFNGWDYMIGSEETAFSKKSSIALGFREALLEELEIKQDKSKTPIKLTIKRCISNILIVLLLVAAAHIVVLVVDRSKKIDPRAGWWIQNEITIVMSAITVIYPNVFEAIGLLEGYHPRRALRWQLGRVMLLNLLSFYTLIIALFRKVQHMIIRLTGIRLTNAVMFQSFANITGSSGITSNKTFGASCYTEVIECQTTTEVVPRSTNDPLTYDFEPGLTFKPEASALTSNLSTIFKNVTLLYKSIVHVLLHKDEPTPSTETAENDVCYVTYCNGTNSTGALVTKQVNNSCRGDNPLGCTSFWTSERNQTAQLSAYASSLNASYSPIELRELCWETMFGQEIAKLVIMDLIFTVIAVLLIDFVRSLFVKYFNHCWCWDLERSFPEYGEFKIAENILHLINNQGMVWMGMFFAPVLPFLNIFKLILLMYFRSWILLTCNVPHERIFKASKSNNFYLWLLLMMLFLCTLPVVYTIVWLEPSWHCGPFSDYNKMYHVATKEIFAIAPSSFHWVLSYLASPGVVIPLLILLVLVIYYLTSLNSSLKEAVVDLKNQLKLEKDSLKRLRRTYTTNNKDVPSERVYSVPRIERRMVPDFDIAHG